jgi:GNAT superfamily N-acetyltransferase
VVGIEQWANDRLDDLVALVDEAVPHERLTPDELLAVAWDEPGLVAGTADGSAVVVASCVPDDPGDDDRDHGHAVGSLHLLAVHPGERRLGIGRALLGAAEDWAAAAGARAVVVGPAHEPALWPGVDVHRMPAMLCLLEAAGYRTTGARCNLSVPVTYRADPPDGVAIRRVIEPADEAAVRAFVADEFPRWTAPVARSIDHGSCLAARLDDGDVVGFASHSVDRAGWLGPMGTAVAHRHRGIGAALLGAVAQDLMVANLRDLDITGADAVGLFVRAGGAVSRVFRTYRRDLDG